MADGGIISQDSLVNLTEYPLFDSWFFGVGESSLQANTPMFQGGTQNQPQFTNMQQSGQIPGGGVFYMTGVRCSIFTMSLADTEYTVAYGNISANTSPTSSPARMLDLIPLLIYATQVTVTIDDFPAMVVPLYMLPAAGGPSGFTTVSGRSIVTNGLAGKEAAGKFTKPLKVSALSAFRVSANINVFGKSSIAGAFLGIAQGGTLAADFSPLNQFNQADGLKAGQFVLPGFITRRLGGAAS